MPAAGNLTFQDAQDCVSWKVKFPAAGTYKLTASIAAAKGDSAVVVEVAGQKLEAKLPATEAWDKFATVELGSVEIKQAGEQTLAIKPREAATWRAVNLRWVKMAKGGN